MEESQASPPKSPWLPSLTVLLPTPHADRIKYLLLCVLAANLRSRAADAGCCTGGLIVSAFWLVKKATEKEDDKEEGDDVGSVLSCQHQWNKTTHTAVGLDTPETFADERTPGWRRKQGAGMETQTFN